jgi:hypothetical protein
MQPLHEQASNSRFPEGAADHRIDQSVANPILPVFRRRNQFRRP